MSIETTIGSFESYYQDNGFLSRLDEARIILAHTLNKTPLWRIDERDGIEQTIEGIDRLAAFIHNQAVGYELDGLSRKSRIVRVTD